MSLQSRKEAQKRWYQNVVKERKRIWFLEHGPCRECGSKEKLELDHIDPTNKISHSIWSWGEVRRNEELAKCQILCHDCHTKKSTQYRHITGFFDTMPQTIKPPEGMAWCYLHKDFASLEMFTKNAAKRNGIQDECKNCRSLKRRTI